MARKLTQIFSTLFFYSILFNFLGLTMQDESCPYPCYPPPTGPGSGTPTTGTPATTLIPPSSSGSSGYSYPPPSGYNPTPTGNLPNYHSPPYDNNIYGPPPPDPILPYFPYYYKKPPHKTDDQSSATLTTLGKSTVVVTAANVLVFVFVFTCCLIS